MDIEFSSKKCAQAGAKTLSSKLFEFADCKISCKAESKILHVKIDCKDEKTKNTAEYSVKKAAEMLKELDSTV
ncbi:MAG: hypothetical protein WC492_00850 [Candidatus Micrarchaeia archaeon]